MLVNGSSHAFPAPSVRWLCRQPCLHTQSGWPTRVMLLSFEDFLNSFASHLWTFLYQLCKTLVKFSHARLLQGRSQPAIHSSQDHIQCLQIWGWDS